MFTQPFATNRLVVISILFVLAGCAKRDDLAADIGEGMFTHSASRILEGETDSLDVKYIFPVKEKRQKRIVNIQNACGCTAATIDKTAILVGKHAALGLTIDLRSRVGPQLFMSRVAFDDGSEYTLNVKATIVRRLAFEEDRIRVCRDGTCQRRATLLVATRERELVPDDLDLNLSTNQIEMTVSPPVLKSADNDGINFFSVACIFKIPSASVGTMGESIVARLKKAPRAVQAQLSIDNESTRLFEIVPSYVFFGTSVKIGDKKSVSIRRLDGVNLEDLCLTNLPIFLDGDLQPGETPGTRVLILRINQPFTGKQVFSGNVQLTDRTSRQLLSIPLSGISQPKE